MSLNGIMGAAVSGLQTAQTGLRAVSDNIANVDTPGYVRKPVDILLDAYAEAQRRAIVRPELVGERCGLRDRRNVVDTAGRAVFGNEKLRVRAARKGSRRYR